MKPIKFMIIKTSIKTIIVLEAVICCLCLFSPTGWAKDCWMSVEGAGKKNGTAKEHAYSASKKNADRCWKQTGADGTMYVLEGEYSMDNGAFWVLDISSKNDGPDHRNSYKRLVGVGNVTLIGPRPIPYSPASKEMGGRWIGLGAGVHHILIKNFNVRQVAEGIAAQKGENHHLWFDHLHFQDTRQNIFLLGHPDCESMENCERGKNELSRDIVINNTSGVRYSKRHIRLSHGIHHVKVLRSTADSQFLDEDFAVGFDVENPSHDILFKKCSSQRNKYTGSKYWNGDGFKAEDQTYNIRWIDCSAFENADGGFDIKTKNGYLQHVTALRNNRNIRSWHPEGITIKNADASYSKHHGGEGGEAGIWALGNLNCYDCTVRNNKIQVMTEKGPTTSYIRFFDSVLSTNLEDSVLMSQEDGTHIDLVRTHVLQKSGAVNQENLGTITYASRKS